MCLLYSGFLAMYTHKAVLAPSTTREEEVGRDARRRRMERQKHATPGFMKLHVQIKPAPARRPGGPAGYMCAANGCFALAAHHPAMFPYLVVTQPGWALDIRGLLVSGPLTSCVPWPMTQDEAAHSPVFGPFLPVMVIATRVARAPTLLRNLGIHTINSLLLLQTHRFVPVSVTSNLGFGKRGEARVRVDQGVGGFTEARLGVKN